MPQIEAPTSDPGIHEHHLGRAEGLQDPSCLAAGPPVLLCLSESGELGVRALVSEAKGGVQSPPKLTFRKSVIYDPWHP